MPRKAVNGWSTTFAFRMQVGEQGLLILSGNTIYIIWRSGSGLNAVNVFGSHSPSFTLDGDVVTCTNSVNLAWLFIYG